MNISIDLPDDLKWDCRSSLTGEGMYLLLLKRHSFLGITWWKQMDEEYFGTSRNHVRAWGSLEARIDDAAQCILKRLDPSINKKARNIIQQMNVRSSSD